MFVIPCCNSPSTIRSITAFPSPIPWNEGSTTTSHMIALKTPSPVALAKATGFWVFTCSTQRSEFVFSRAILIFSGSRLGNPTETKTELRWSRLRPVAVRRRAKPRDWRSWSEMVAGRWSWAVMGEAMLLP
ncbi:hypothetical protein Droror1_Dr00022327 [Drosera rotundifolia]